MTSDLALLTIAFRFRDFAQFGLVAGVLGIGILFLLAGVLRLRGTADVIAFWTTIGFCLLAIVSVVILFVDGLARLPKPW